MALCKTEIFGANPANIHWNIVRGDTAQLDIEFFESDEETSYDISSWIFTASAYNPRDGFSDELEVSVSNGVLSIIALPDLTERWGTGVGYRVAQLTFDLEVIIDDRVWTPIVGTISVIGDVTGGIL